MDSDMKKIAFPGFKEIFSLVIFFVAAVGFLSCAQKRKYNLPVRTLVIKSADSVSNPLVEAEIAVKEEERNFGFMERKEIPDGTGMLFVFEKDQILNFWMKNTPHPLSIAYIDASGTITDILDMKPFSESSVTSSRSVRYALEVPQGWFKTMHVQTGEKVMFLDEGQEKPLKELKF